jgi:hypothetical protein
MHIWGTYKTGGIQTTNRHMYRVAPQLKIIVIIMICFHSLLYNNADKIYNNLKAGPFWVNFCPAIAKLSQASTSAG